jgi:hypothetical protein
MRKELFASLFALLGSAALAQPPMDPLPLVAPDPFTLPTESVGFLEELPTAPRLWASGEALLWWIQGSPVPAPLVTSAFADPNAPLGFGQNLLLGGGTLRGEEHGGARFTLGYWLDDEQTVGLEVGGFFLGRSTVSRSVGSPGAPVLATPFFDVTGFTTANGQPGEAFANFTEPGVTSGSARLSISNQLDGVELNAVLSDVEFGDGRIDYLAGFRTLAFDEQLDFTFSSQGIPGSRAAGFAFTSLDTFHTRSRFYGGQLGIRGQRQLGAWNVSATGKLALGDMHETADVAGSTLTNGVVQPGGAFAQATNSGRHTRDQFAVIPEAGLTVGYDVSRRLRVFAGYTFLYVSDVARAGNQIDRGLNATQIVGIAGPGAVLAGPPRPTVDLRDSDLWAQGINFGVQFKY